MLSTAYSQITIHLLETFDYPGKGNSTVPHGINNLDQVVGTYVDAEGFARSFLRLPDGSFPNIVDFHVKNDIYARGINSSQEFCGYVAATRFTSYATTWNRSYFTEIIYCNSEGSSYWFGINDNGFTTGSVQCGANAVRYGLAPFVDTFTLPGVGGGNAYGINNLNQIVGEYSDSPAATAFMVSSAKPTATSPSRLTTPAQSPHLFLASTMMA